jgi:iron(III) transport system ATP-binding protein
MIAITIDKLVKKFGDTVALNGISLRIEPGELFFLLGPSGCGKTTLLRNIAGFYIPDEGRILFGDEDVTNLPPHKRNTGMMFQSYALWPHMTVAKNVAFGLEERRVPQAEIRQRVQAALESVQMGPYAERKIAQLSGGQQQRVALARALVIRPRCVLLDEPLSNLDARLRLEMRSEIRRVCKENGLTAIYVTHDQKEALSISDRMAVLEDGRIAQIGTPEQVYRRPKHASWRTSSAKQISSTAKSNPSMAQKLSLKPTRGFSRDSSAIQSGSPLRGIRFRSASAPKVGLFAQHPPR